MEMPFTPDQQAFLRDAVAAGRLRGPEDAMREALELWESRERARARLLVQIDQAEASLADGKGRVITEQSMHDLADEVCQRGRTRFAARQQHNPR